MNLPIDTDLEMEMRQYAVELNLWWDGRTLPVVRTLLSHNNQSDTNRYWCTLYDDIDEAHKHAQNFIRRKYHNKATYRIVRVGKKNCPLIRNHKITMDARKQSDTIYGNIMRYDRIKFHG